MSVFEYEYSNKDRQLVVGQEDNSTFGVNPTDYIRLTIYPTEGLENIVALPGTGEQAIFYASFEDSINFSMRVDSSCKNIPNSPVEYPVSDDHTPRVQSSYLEVNSSTRPTGGSICPCNMGTENKDNIVYDMISYASSQTELSSVHIVIRN